jgi:hypothetical protein
MRAAPLLAFAILCAAVTPGLADPVDAARLRQRAAFANQMETLLAQYPRLARNIKVADVANVPHAHVIVWKCWIVFDDMECTPRILEQ